MNNFIEAKFFCGSVNHDCYIHAHFTGTIQEAIIMENYDVHETISTQHLVGVAGSLSNQGKTTKPIERTLTLVGQRSGNNMGVKW